VPYDNKQIPLNYLDSFRISLNLSETRI